MKSHDDHHRKPKSQGGTRAKGNLSKVPIKKHRAWHMLFGNKTPEQIAAVINDTWLDPDFIFIVERR